MFYARCLNLKGMWGARVILKTRLSTTFLHYSTGEKFYSFCHCRICDNGTVNTLLRIVSAYHPKITSLRWPPPLPTSHTYLSNIYSILYRAPRRPLTAEWMDRQCERKNKGNAKWGNRGEGFKITWRRVQYLSGRVRWCRCRDQLRRGRQRLGSAVCR